MREREFKLRMRRGESVDRMADKFSTEPPKFVLVCDGKRSYLWIGGENGPCYATISGRVTLRKIARSILAEVGE